MQEVRSHLKNQCNERFQCAVFQAGGILALQHPRKRMDDLSRKFRDVHLSAKLANRLHCLLSDWPNTAAVSIEHAHDHRYNEVHVLLGATAKDEESLEHFIACLLASGSGICVQHTQHQRQYAC